MSRVILLTCLVGFSAVAGETFTVTRKGNTKTYDSEEYVVVKRRKGSVAAKPKPPCPTPTPLVVEKEVFKKANTVKAYGGVGPNGFDVDKLSSSAQLSKSFDAVMGLGYSRQLDPTWSAEAVGLTNGTLVLGAGLSF